MSLIRYRDLSMLYRRRKRMSEFVQDQSRLASLSMVQSVVEQMRAELRRADKPGVPFTLGEVGRWSEDASAELRQAAEKSWRMGFYDASDSSSSAVAGLMAARVNEFVNERTSRLAEAAHARVVGAYRAALQDGADHRRALHRASMSLRLIGSLTAAAQPEDDISAELLDAFFVEKYSGVPAAEYLAADVDARTDWTNETFDKMWDGGHDDEWSFWMDRVAEDASGSPPDWNDEWGDRPLTRLQRLEQETGKQLLPLDLSAPNAPAPGPEWRVLSDTIGRESAVYLMNEGLQAAFVHEGAAVKMWVATLDERVRWNHELMHGVCIDASATFEMPASQGSGFNYVLMKYPGHCDGPAYIGCPPGDVYNCRCTMVAGSSCEELQELFDSLAVDQITVAAESSPAREVPRPSTIAEWADAGFVPGGPSRFEFDPSSAATSARLTRTAIDREWRDTLRERFPSWVEHSSVPRRWMGALFEYIDGELKQIQAVLRDNLWSLNRFEAARTRQNLKDMWRLFDSRRAPTALRLYRGVDLRRSSISWDDAMKARPEGAEWFDLGINSTSASIEIARDFTLPTFGASADNFRLLELTVPEGFPAVPASVWQDAFEQNPTMFSPFTEGYPEAEVMLPPGTTYRVTGVREEVVAGETVSIWEVEVGLTDPQTYADVEDDPNFPEDSIDRVVSRQIYGQGDSTMLDPNSPANINWKPDWYVDAEGMG